MDIKGLAKADNDFVLKSFLKSFIIEALLSWHFLAGLALVPLCGYLANTVGLWALVTRAWKRMHNHGSSNKPARPYLEIQPLRFKWTSEGPKKLRPYKPKFFLTMDIQKATISEVINIDRDFLNRIDIRRDILEEHPGLCIQCLPVAEPAVRELYALLTAHILPNRFPTVFGISPSQKSLKNLISHLEYPLEHRGTAHEVLGTLGVLVDEDFMLLLPSEENGGEQSLCAYVVCFASGFTLPTLLGKPISHVHRKVPGYAEKLQRSMAKWLDRLEVGTVVRRCNWTITTHGRLRNEEGESQLYDDEFSPRAEERASKFDVKDAHLRAELQHIYRLPQSRAIVFNYKTYLYPLDDVKAEGQGETLSRAIEGLGQGNVPDMTRYKGGTIWGTAVCAYLRAP